MTQPRQKQQRTLIRPSVRSQPTVHRSPQSRPVFVVTWLLARRMLIWALFVFATLLLTGLIGWEVFLPPLQIVVALVTAILALFLLEPESKTVQGVDAAVVSPLPPVLYSARPSFVEGVSRILDFGSTLDGPPLLLNDAEEDRLAFRLDWMELGFDLAACEILTRRDLELRQQMGTWLVPFADKSVKLPFGHERS